MKQEENQWEVHLLSKQKIPCIFQSLQSIIEERFYNQQSKMQTDSNKVLTDSQTCSTARDPEAGPGDRVYTLPQEFDSFFKWDSEKQSFFMDANWQQMEGSVLGWFTQRGILQGEPEGIKIKLLHSSKKKVVLKRQFSENQPLLSRLGSKIGSSLTISV